MLRISACPGVLALLLALSAPTALGQFDPDLTIVQIVVTPPNPAVGQTVLIEARAVNAGAGTPVADTRMHFWFDRPTPPTDCATANVSIPLVIAFPPETTRLFTTETVYNAPGTYRIHCWVDCPDDIPETDEMNNQLTRDVTVGLGDLRIEQIAPAVDDPTPGQSFMMNVTVRNTGPAIAGLWRCGVAYQQTAPTGCALQQVEQRLDFPANSTFIVPFGPVSYPAEGSYPIWASVDCDNLITESDETNNQSMGSIFIGQPDLLVTNIALSDTTPIVGQTIDVDVTVANVGSAASGPFRVSLARDSSAAPEDGCPLTDLQYVNPGLDVEQSATVQFQVVYTEARQHRLWAFADSCDNLVPEAREDNNRLSRDVNVGAGGVGPDLIVERIVATEIADPALGQVVTFDVVVTNVGNVATGPFRVGDFAPTTFPGTYPSSHGVIGQPGPRSGGVSGTTGNWSDCSWRSREIVNLGPGASATVSFWRYYWEAGDYSFSAYADVCGSGAAQRVAESSETNNGQTISITVAGCDADADRDGICDEDDFCPNTPDPLNNDTDGDGMGDVCDSDDDNDGVPDESDCAPRNRLIYPGARENCADGVDNNCDGRVDEGAVDWYRDADGDGFGVADDVVSDCVGPAGYAAVAGDCDDTRAHVYPGANGPCDDGLDNDCDGTVDNEQTVWGRDTDADGYTDAADTIVDDDGACDGQPAGYVLASATPDPDDADFMVPEPVRPEPITVALSRARSGRIAPAELTLRRAGAEPFDYATNVTYAVAGENWLTIAPATGTASGGAMTLLLTPSTRNLDRGEYEATVAVTINGSAAFDVPVTLEVRNPILTIRHRGQGGGSVWVEYDDDPNGAANEYINVELLNTGAGMFSGSLSIPEGRSAFVRMYTEGDCSDLDGLFDESGLRVNDPNWNYLESNEPCRGCQVYPVWVRMNGDRELAAEFDLSGLACTACAATMLSLNIAGLICVGRRRRG